MPPNKVENGLTISEYDRPYEEELARYPYSIRTWLRYIEHKEHGSFEIYVTYMKEL
ncbi:unnamed protein product [Cunninghamella blakesleeana]